MRKEYNFSKGVKNPYAEQLKEKVCLSISNEVIEYFAQLSKDTGFSIDQLINSYLLHCVKNKIDFISKV